MPVYNEEGAIVSAVDEVKQHVLQLIPDSELVVVDDGSRDGTGRLLDDAAAADARIKVIHQPNGGHGAALLRGLNAAQGEYVFLIDSDRQIPLDSFKSAWAEVTAGRDAVFGVRRRRYDPVLRLYLSRLIRHSVNVLFRVNLQRCERAVQVVQERHLERGPLVRARWHARAVAVSGDCRQVARLQHPRDRRDPQGT